jgi:hypothetical protein
MNIFTTSQYQPRLSSITNVAPISIDSLYIDLGEFQKEVSLDISTDSLCIDLGEFQKEVILDIIIDSLCIDLGEFPILMSRLTSF